MRCPATPSLALLLAALALSGCQVAGSIAGGITGAATGVGTANPVVGYAVGVGTKALVDELSRYISRSRKHSEQDAIAKVVGETPVGATADWRIVHTIPLFDDEHGTLLVADEIRNSLATCKEVVFTVIAGNKPTSKRANYVTTACRDDGKWRWAEAEPATERWGFLQ